MSAATDRAAIRASVAAPAKLNTHLEVLGRRDDGFHVLRTRMVAVGPCDLVHVALSPRGDDEGRDDAGGASVRLDVSGPAASDDVLVAADDNLVVRAANAALAALRELEPNAADVALDLRLVKHVPSRAGLGGASADASAALLACDEVFAARFGRRLGRARLKDIAASLGSDTVFFLAARFGGEATARGRGEIVEPAVPSAQRPWFALVVPDVGCSTPEVYRAFAAGARDARSGAPRRNDLECAALEVEPGLAPWFEALGPRFGLSGSGSSLFAEAADADDADELVRHAERAASSIGRVPRLVVATRALGHGALPLRVPRSSPRLSCSERRA